MGATDQDDNAVNRRAQLTLAAGGSSPLKPAMRLLRIASGAALVVCLVLLAPACAQTDEIQVYTGEINKPGEFSITVHNNYTPIGPTRPAFMGGIVPNHSLNGVPEYALGVTPWLELDAYLPLYTITGDERALIDGAKVRALFVSPNAAERSFWYGVNFELSIMSGIGKKRATLWRSGPSSAGVPVRSISCSTRSSISRFTGGRGRSLLLRRTGSPIIYPRLGHLQSSTMPITVVSPISHRSAGNIMRSSA